MATKPIKKDETVAAGAEAPDAPPIDISDQAVKRLIKLAKKRGYVTIDQINAVLPQEEVNSDQIEDIYAMFNEMGVNVIENDEAEEGEAATETADDEPDEPEEQAPRATAIVKSERSSEPLDRTDDPVRMYLREMGSVELLARGRDRHSETHRGRARGDDRRAVRKPADVSGHHHLA